jgi:hypothetical protein
MCWSGVCECSHRSLGAAITIEIQYLAIQSILVQRDKRKGSAEGMGIGKLFVSSGNIEWSSERGLGKFGSETRMRDTNDGTKNEKEEKKHANRKNKTRNISSELVRNPPRRDGPGASQRQITRRQHIYLPWTTDCERIAAAAVSCWSTVCATERACHVIGGRNAIKERGERER